MPVAETFLGRAYGNTPTKPLPPPPQRPFFQSVIHAVAPHPAVIAHPAPSQGLAGSLSRIARTVSPQGQAQTRAQNAAQARTALEQRTAQQRQQLLGRITNALTGPLGKNTMFGAGLAGLLAQQAQIKSEMPRQAQMNQSIAQGYSTADDAYNRYLGDLWGRVAGFYPKGSKQPKATFDPVHLPDAFATWLSGSDPKAAAYVMPGKQGARPVHYEPATARGYGQGSAYDAEVPIHEWAHVFQAPQLSGGYPANRPLVEGGAEAFKQRVARALGMPFEPAPGYQGFVNLVRQRGAPYVMSDQFDPRAFSP